MGPSSLLPPSAGVEKEAADAAELYEFGPFRLEPAERRLSRNSDAIILTPKVFDTLVLLVRRSGHLIEKEELIQTLWPDSFVEEGNLTNNIFLLRKALGEDPKYIETVPKRGYRFVGAVRLFPGTKQQRAETRTEREMEGGLCPAVVPVLHEAPERKRHRGLILAASAVSVTMLVAIGATLWSRRNPKTTDRLQWVQLTKLPDSAAQPTLSHDGRMLAFVRGPSTWIGPGQIYVKLLPDGEPVQLTHDDLIKTDPTFSPDGSRIAFSIHSTFSGTPGWFPLCMASHNP
jgi:DNA-binding winged helix-turn-helix (wHTH) protein